MATAEYNAELDILVVEDGDYDDFGRNVELGGFVIDLATDGDLLGVEIVDASQKLPFTREELGSIEDTSVELEQDEELIRVAVTVVIDGQKSVISSQHPRATA